MKNNFIRSTSHTLKFANCGKLNRLYEFLKEYQRVGNLILDEIWDKGYGDFSIEEDKLSLPKYLDYKKFEIDTTLSARALSSLVNQVVGVISGSTEKRRRILWLRDEFKKENKEINSLQKTLLKSKFKCSKPYFNVSAELSSKCAVLQKGEKSFDWFLILNSLGKSFGKIKIPIKNTKCSLKWLKSGKRLGSFLIKSDKIEIRWEINSEIKENGRTVGADQGLKTVITFSDKQITPEFNKDDYSLNKICEKIARKKKGSNAFKRAQEHRKNFINWSINQLNLNDINRINLENIVNINFGKRRTRKMSAWTNTLIRDKLMRLGEELGVQVNLQSSSYRSQRCSKCGNTRKANRKGKIYSCKNCGNVIDADLNAALNHEIELPDAKFLLGRKLNLKKGFFWKSEGVFTFDGQELRVPDLLK